MSKDYKVLYQHIGYTFQNQALLEQALTHRSAGSNHNERLEYLGDAVLGLTIANQLYHQFPKAREGQMSQLRASLVRSESLADIARTLALGDYVLMGTSECKSGSHDRDSVLEDLLEALIGAIYLDSDFNIVQQTVLQWFTQRLQSLSLADNVLDPKSQLQATLQQQGYELPHYDIINTEGAEHQQTFTVRCTVPELSLVAQGQGSSRKKAEQVAAQKVLQAYHAL